MNTGDKKIDDRSRERLKGVHPDLVRLLETAAKDPKCPKFAVLEGLRTKATQEQYVAKGVSWTMNSRHLTGHAADCAMYVDWDKDGDLDLRWDWPLYYAFADYLKPLAVKLGIAVEWGGDWSGKKKDGPHWQLSRAAYPTRK